MATEVTKIEFDDKSKSGVGNQKKFTDSDVNEIKKAVNDNADILTDALRRISLLEEPTAPTEDNG